MGLTGNDYSKMYEVWKELKKAGIQNFHLENMTDEFVVCMQEDTRNPGLDIKGKFEYCFDSLPDYCDPSAYSFFSKGSANFAKNFYNQKPFLKQREVAEKVANMVKDMFLLHYLKKDMEDIEVSDSNKAKIENFYKLMKLDFGNSEKLFKDTNYCHADSMNEMSTFYGTKYYPYCDKNAHEYNEDLALTTNIKNTKDKLHHEAIGNQTCTDFISKISQLKEHQKNNLSFETQLNYNKCQLQQEAYTTLNLQEDQCAEQALVGKDKCTEQALLDKVRGYVCNIEKTLPKGGVEPQSLQNIEKLLCAEQDGNYILQDLDSLDAIELDNFFGMFEVDSIGH